MPAPPGEPRHTPTQHAAARRLVAVAAAVILVLSACSEAEDPTVASTDEAPAATDQPSGDDANSDEPAGDDPEPSEDEPSGDEATGDDAALDGAANEQASTDGDDGAGGDSGTAGSDLASDSVVGGLAGQPWFLGQIPAQPVAADPGLEPVVIGMINQEDTPFGSFPEVRVAAETAVAFVNAELGGVDGRPIELRTCITSFSPEQSASCAQDMVQTGVVALVGGVDVASHGSFPILEQNELPMVGGIPAGLVEQQSEFAFSFSGGGAGAAAAFMKHAADNGASRVLLAYGEFESFEVAARDYAAVVGESLGLQVELLSFSLFATDYLPVLTKAQDVGADAIIVLAADAACVPVMQNKADLGLDAQLYLTGACATEAIIDAAGPAMTGVLFNAEGPVTDGDAEGELYEAALARYATAEGGGAGTVGFRAMMNLYGILVELGADNLSPESIVAAMRGTVDQPSFWGHPYTCDGNQVPGLPALCAPQQILFEIPADGVPTGVGDWIDTAQLFQVVGG